MNKPDAKSVLIVSLSDIENENQSGFHDDTYHYFNPFHQAPSRKTILCGILEYSQNLMRVSNLPYVNIVLVDHGKAYPKRYINSVCSHLDEYPFIAGCGYVTATRMGLYYNEGKLNYLGYTDDKDKWVDIPRPAVAAFRHYSDTGSAFLVYDKWNNEKYLDLELALFSKEMGQNFQLVEIDKPLLESFKEDGNECSIHKAAIYNELFVKNTFNRSIAHLNASGSSHHLEQNHSEELKIVRRLNKEIGTTSSKLDYLSSKIGNFEPLKYNVHTAPATPALVNRLGQYFTTKPNEHITFSLASIPERIGFLKRTIQSIYDQCDKIHVYLNGYSEVPEFLHKPKITFYRSQDHGDLSANGKVWFLREKPEEGYVFLIDDDIIYPKDYVKSMISNLKKYQNRFAACVHGSIFSDSLRWYYQRSSMFPFKRALLHDCFVNLPGSGTFAFHTNTLKLDYDDFQPFTMVDLILGILCREQKIPIVSVARKADWLKVQKDESGKDLWSAFKSVITLHTPTALANGPWDYNATKAYVLPYMEEMFDVHSASLVEELQLDKQFLYSAYKQTLPQLWSFAGRLQRATEKNYEKFLNVVFNDEIDKCFDSLVYDKTIGKAALHNKNLDRLNKRINHLMIAASSNEEHTQKFIDLFRSVNQTESDVENKQNYSGSKITSLLSELQYNVRASNSEVINIRKTHEDFMDRKKKLARLQK